MKAVRSAYCYSIVFVNRLLCKHNIKRQTQYKEQHIFHLFLALFTYPLSFRGIFHSDALHVEPLFAAILIFTLDHSSAIVLTKLQIQYFTTMTLLDVGKDIASGKYSLSGKYLHTISSTLSSLLACKSTRFSLEYNF